MNNANYSSWNMNEEDFQEIEDYSRIKNAEVTNKLDAAIGEFNRFIERIYHHFSILSTTTSFF